MNTNDMPLITLNGTPEQRGYHYGQAAQNLIAAVVQKWRHNLGTYGKNNQTTEPVNADDYLAAFYQQTDYLSAIEQWAPDLLAEVQGIAEGAGQRFEDVLGIQLADEEWIFGLRRGLDKPTEKCTAFAVPDAENGLSYAGQNMDIGSWVDGRQVLLRVMPSVAANGQPTPEALVFSKAGSVGLNGVNAQGLGITCNTLSQLNHATNGLPVSFIVRTVLQQHSIDEAEAFLRRIQHASGQNYMLSSKGDMRCFECCGTSVVRYAPEKYQGRLFHSNHPLVNTDENDFLAPEKRRSDNTVARFDSICHRLGDSEQTLTLADIKAALSAHDNAEHPVSRNANKTGSAIGFTAGSSIYEFSDKPRLHLAAGPPCVTDFKTFDFKTLN